jgi:hypothetical protein
MGGAAAFGNFVIYIVVIAVPLMAFWLAFNGVRTLNRLRGSHRGRPAPAGPPIERLASDLRRVRRSLLSLPEGTNNVRRRATEQAYDALLAQAALALRVEQQLQQAPDVLGRELERIRVEDELTEAGLRIR